MKERRYSNLTEALEKLADEGYRDTFSREGTHLKNTRTGEVFQPEDLRVVCSFRFEGESNPDDMAVVYAVKGVKEGEGVTEKGTITDAFGVYADPKLGDLVAEIPDVRKNFKKNDRGFIPSDPIS